MESRVKAKIDRIAPGMIMSMDGLSYHFAVDKIQIQPIPTTVWSEWPTEPQIILVGRIVEWNEFEERWRQIDMVWTTDLKPTDTNETCLSMRLFQKKWSKGKISLYDEDGLNISEPALMRDYDFYPGDCLNLKNGKRAIVTEISRSKIGYAVKPTDQDIQRAVRNLPVYAVMMLLLLLCSAAFVDLASQISPILVVVVGLLSLLGILFVGFAACPWSIEPLFASAHSLQSILDSE